MPSWIKILFAILPKKAITELVLSGLKKLALMTNTKIDDELLENIEKWLRENNILDPKDLAKVKENLNKDKPSQTKE